MSAGAGPEEKRTPSLACAGYIVAGSLVVEDEAGLATPTKIATIKFEKFIYPEAHVIERWVIRKKKLKLIISSISKSFPLIPNNNQIVTLVGYNLSV